VATLFDLADGLRLQVPTSCRRSGRCHECVVEVKAGAERLCPRTPEETFLRDPYRLACRAEIVACGEPVAFEPLRRRLRILHPEPAERRRPIDPAVTVAEGVVLLDGEPLEPVRGGAYGLAVDLGTTTVVLELVDLATGDVLEVVALENPQRFGGSDVMSRISFAEEGGGEELRQAVRRALNRELRDVYARAGIDRREAYEVVVVGNTTMRDLFFGLDVSSIGQRPYKSLTEHELLAGERETTSLAAPCHAVGVKASPRGRVWSPPLVASHLGADLAADLVALGFDEPADEVRMLVDVGTNTEVVVAAGDRLVAASCPAGPAFEGWLVTYGIPGGDGAIESLRLREDGSFAYEVIGGVEPVGICGSGLVDLLAELRRAGLMSALGAFADRRQTLAIVPEAGITFSRADASALAQAKAANTAGQWILLRELGLSPNDVGRLYLAGGFAASVDVANAAAIGFIAPVPAERIVKVGNAALDGARELLLSRSARARLERLVRRIEHVELELVPDFFDVYVQSCRLEPMPSGLGGANGRAAA
jgi:uncharacterized 2Fe-2S/4Fe-4S cluster protein (DUF4445 family)